MTVAARASAAYFEPKIGAKAVSVLPGHHAVIDDPEICVTTLLGSCVAACIRDRDTGVGGLNHFLLPGEDRAEGSAKSTRYGVHAMEVLVNDILRRGGRRDGLEAKIFGGANVIDTSAANTVGDRNASFVQRYLKTEGIRLLANDVGGDRARRVFFFPGTGRVSVLRLAPTEAPSMRDSERRLRRDAQRSQSGGVELF
ncbi:MAG: chemoreceptor glutamine deamidase CheD [Pseudomonadota bacterium]